MCGLVGCLGSLTTTHEGAFKDLLIVDAIRGPHSTGMASYNSMSKDINIAKEVCGPTDLIRHADFTRSMAKVNRLLLGHNRWATKGVISRANAHPFKQGHIVGAHNGTLTYLGQQKLQDKENEFGTDSEAIFWSISTRGFAETYKYLANPVFQNETTGNAFAITWFDTSTNKFYLIRNKKRSLYYGYTEKGDAMFWASELGMLQWIMFRNGLIGDKFKTYSVNEDTLYEWTIPQGHDKKVSEPVMTKLETPAPLYTPHQQQKTYTQPPFDFSQNSHKTSNVVSFPTQEALKKKVEEFRQPYKNDKGTVLNKRTVEGIVSEGCFYCGEKTFEWNKFGYFPTFGSVNTTQFLCTECYLDPIIRQIIMDCSNG